ncbi:MAG: hypothetical protein QXO67_01240 [Candidatus Bathyarchaeia archaeon]
MYGKTESTLKKLLLDIRKALTADPSFLKRQILTVLAQAYIDGKALSFSDLKRALGTTSTRLARCLKMLEKEGLIVKTTVRRFPRISAYKIVDQKNVAYALQYYAEDQIAAWLLNQIIHLQTFWKEHLNLISDGKFVQAVKDHINIVNEHFTSRHWALLSIQAEDITDKNVDKIVEEESFAITNLFINPNLSKAYFETKIKVVVTQTLRLFLGDLLHVCLQINSENLRNISDLSIAAREKTPFLLYGYTILKVAAETAKMIGLQPLKLFSECFDAATRQPIEKKLEKLLAQAQRLAIKPSWA